MGSSRASTRLGSLRRCNESTASDADDTIISAGVDLPRPRAPPPPPALRAGLENSCSTPSCQADFLPGRPFAVPLFGSAHDAASAGSGGGADHAGRHTAHPIARPGLTLLVPLHPCHAAFLPCRPSATPPIREHEREQPFAHIELSADGAFDSRPFTVPPHCVPTPQGDPSCADALLVPCRTPVMPASDSPMSTFRADERIRDQPRAGACAGAGGVGPSLELPAHAAFEPTHPACAASLPCRSPVAPTFTSAFHTSDWLPQATAHIPARSGRQQTGDSRQRACQWGSKPSQPWDRQGTSLRDCARAGRL